MALSLKFSSSIVNYTSLNISDASGVYNEVSNPTGWGTPNEELADVTYAHIVVTLPNLSVVDIDLMVDLGIDFSTATTADLVYNITSTMLYGTSGLLPDGVYQIYYNIEGNDDYSITSDIMTYYVIQGSVFNKIALIPEYYTCADCNNQYIKETTTTFMLLQALIASSQYSNTVRFKELLSGLTDIMLFDSANTSSCGC